MKTQTKKSSAKGHAGSSKAKGVPKPKNSSRKSIENTDLNTDDEERTNASREEDYNAKKETDNPSSAVDDTSVEEEQDREVLRKMEDSHPDEIMK